jgi:Tfp pilus assembly protein PilV
MRNFPKITKKYRPQSGFGMIEILVAASIIALSVLAVMGVAQKSVAVARQSLHAEQAGFLLEEGAEGVRVLRDNGWSNISALTAGTNYYPAFSGGTWILSVTPNTVGIFTRKVVVAAVNRDSTTQDISPSGTNDPGTKLVTITVSWPEGADTITKTLSFYILDILS